MAVILYRKGKTHTVNGIECEIKRVVGSLFSGELEQGWFFSPEEAYKKPVNVDPYKMSEEAEANADLHVKKALASIEKAETEKENKADFIKDAKTIDGMDNDEVRIAAEKAGIANFKTARITTLKNKLKA